LSTEPTKVPGRLAGLGAYLSARRMRAVGFVAALALGFVGMITAVEITSRPQFCGSCHVMAPYYASWQQSGHKNVACVECHISPGVTAEIRKKYEALSMVARYFTGTYSQNPWTEVDDAARRSRRDRQNGFSEKTMARSYSRMSSFLMPSSLLPSLFRMSKRRAMEQVIVTART
jgi:hypothetical protein